MYVLFDRLFTLGSCLIDNRLVSRSVCGQSVPSLIVKHFSHTLLINTCYMHYRISTKGIKNAPSDFQVCYKKEEELVDNF